MTTTDELRKFIAAVRAADGHDDMAVAAHALEPHLDAMVNELDALRAVAEAAEKFLRTGSGPISAALSAYKSLRDYRSLTAVREGKS